MVHVKSYVCILLTSLPGRIVTPSRQVPICPFRHVCCSLYRLATKHTEKRTKENENVSFCNTDNHACTGWFVACYFVLLAEIVRELLSVTLEWIEFV